MRKLELLGLIAFLLGAPMAFGEEQGTEGTKATEGTKVEDQKNKESEKASAPQTGWGALEQEPGFKAEARIYALWMMRDEYLQPAHEFKVNMARVELSWTQFELVEAVLEMDVDQLVMQAESTALLRDLYVRIQPFSFVGVQVGQFKRPFSRIELQSRRNLPIIDRGVSNDFIVDHLKYGDRDIGLQLMGRLSEKINLDYAVGVFNGMGMNAEELGLSGFKDIVARLAAKPAKWLSVGVSGSFKFIEDEDLAHFIDLTNLADIDIEDYPEWFDPTNAETTLIRFKEVHHWMTGPHAMVGADAALRFDKLRITVEGMFGENWWFKKYPYTWSTALLASYKKKLVKGWPVWIEPLVMGEVLVLLSNTNEWRNRMWKVTPGVNLHFGDYVRVMIDGEFVFTEGVESDIDGARWEQLWPNEWPGTWMDSQRLLVQFAFSI